MPSIRPPPRTTTRDSQQACDAIMSAAVDVALMEQIVTFTRLKKRLVDGADASDVFGDDADDALTTLKRRAELGAYASRLLRQSTIVAQKMPLDTLDTLRYVSPYWHAKRFDNAARTRSTRRRRRCYRRWH